MLLKLLHKTERGGTLPYPFCEASITLMPKQDKDTQGGREEGKKKKNEARKKARNDKGRGEEKDGRL
jgi:hypothetical protein